MNKKWLVIGGCPRSGTTALLDCMNHHPNIGLMWEFNFFKYINEFKFIFHKEKYLKRFSWIEDINANERSEESKKTHQEYLNFIPREEHLRFIIHSLFESVFPNKELMVVGEKLPVYINEFKEHLNLKVGPIKYIHLFRNPLWVANSFQRRINLTEEKKDIWGENRNLNSVNKAIEHWINSITFYKKNNNRLDMLPVKYEDFFVSPDETHRKIFNFIDVSYFDIPNFSGEKYGPLKELNEEQEEIVRKKLNVFIENWDKYSIDELIELIPN